MLKKSIWSAIETTLLYYSDNNTAGPLWVIWSARKED